MGPELTEMPKVELWIIILLLALFQMAHFLITPAQQLELFQIITSRFYCTFINIITMAWNIIPWISRT